jgi:uncharacterized protein (DUF849 family)
MNMMPLIINFVPTGMVPTKEMTPHVPISTTEIVEDVLRAADLGASIAHLHARLSDGKPTYKKDVFAEIISGVRAHNGDLILCVSTSGRIDGEFEKRSQVLELDGDCQPEMASLTLGSLNFARNASSNPPDMIRGLLQKMNERGIVPELEAFDLGMINFAHYLIKKELLRPPFYFNLLFGNLFSAQPNLPSVGSMIHALPEEATWALAGLGNCQLAINTTAIAHGGHVRVGLEDNIYFDEQRKTLSTNEMQLRRVLDIASAFGRSIATPSEAREIIGMSKTSTRVDSHP